MYPFIADLFLFCYEEKFVRGNTQYLFGLQRRMCFFSILMYTRITIYGLVKKSVMPLFISWITFLLDLQLQCILYRQTIGIPMGTNCAPLAGGLFRFCYKRDFKKSLSRQNQAGIIEAFNSLQDTLMIY